MTGVRLASTVGEADLEQEASGLFLAIGHTPNTAFLKGKFYRMRYLKRRDERRKKSTHFLTQDQLETISKRRVVELHILFDANEAELE